MEEMKQKEAEEAMKRGMELLNSKMKAKSERDTQSQA
jgi:hypothetical protein